MPYRRRPALMHRKDFGIIFFIVHGLWTSLDISSGSRHDVNKRLTILAFVKANMDFIRNVLDRIILVIGVVAAGCIPSFIAQYRQRVGGQLNQVMQDLAPFQVIANQFHHGSIQGLIQYHLSSADPTFHDEGTAIQRMVDTAEQLKQILQALNTDLYHQMLYLLTRADPFIARATWEIYSPSFNITSESVVFALIVGFVVWLAFLALWTLIDRLLGILLAR